MRGNCDHISNVPANEAVITPLIISKVSNRPDTETIKVLGYYVFLIHVSSPVYISY